MDQILPNKDSQNRIVNIVDQKATLPAIQSQEDASVQSTIGY